ncbi:hypothetical protein BG015_009159 [Linnemannia schmuckeri]|uniref:Uncharacterized protein n=1 Tax=Linnemannia schmuckeri TaxID=64567 RepID=A0A9P5RVV4_9FUNG|nr:hypothetical protein BG015_009159 [Linnemannia schmuckeri]
MSWNETQVDQDAAPFASTPKTLALDMDVQSAFVAEEYLYMLTGKGRLVRLPVALLGLADHKDQEIMDLPPLCAISPILSDDDTRTVEGLYGFNQQGQLLKFPAEWKRHARTQGVVDARETVGRALSELEKLSDQVKRLEIQCQLENQRITTYNRLVFELQQSVLATSFRQDISVGGGREDVDMNMEAGLLIETSLSTFSHVVSDGYEGTKRFYARLRIMSRANVDWSRGWSVGVNVARKVEFCPHGKPVTTSHQHNNTKRKRESRMHHQTYASLRTLTRHTPWTLDIELDREMVNSLPLQISIGLLFHEPGLFHQSKAEDDQAGEGGFSAYFVVDSLDLDVVDFVEGVEDPLRYDVPIFVQRRSHPPTITTTSNIKSKDKDKDGEGKEEEDEGCMQCKVEKGNTSGTGTTGTGTGMIEASSVFRPIEFEIDTASIPIPQCLPALLLPLDSCHDGRKAVKIVDMLIAGGKSLGLGGGQACFRTCFIVPEECLSSSGRSDLFQVIRTPTQQGMQGYRDHRNNFDVDAVRSSRNINTWRGGAGVGVGLGAGRGLGAGGHGHIEDPDLRCVWIDLEVPSTNNGGRSGQQQQQGQEAEGMVRAQVLVRGSDLERVFVVRQAIEQRIRALFD